MGGSTGTYGSGLGLGIGLNLSPKPAPQEVKKPDPPKPPRTVWRLSVSYWRVGTAERPLEGIRVVALEQAVDILLETRVLTSSDVTRWRAMTEPTWAKVHYPKIDFQDLYYYSAPKSTEGPKSLADVDPQRDSKSLVTPPPTFAQAARPSSTQVRASLSALA